MTLLAIFGFFMLATLCCLYIPRLTNTVFATFLFFRLGLVPPLKDFNAFLTTGIIFIFAAIMLYLDIKNLRINPFDKK